jgi:CheY-like chemotaxis protein
VLLIEDDSSVRLLIGEVLRELGYAAIEAIDGQTALPIITSNARIDLMITDVGLPGINGRRIAEIARQHRPSLKVLFVTGYAEHATDTSRFLRARHGSRDQALHLGRAGPEDPRHDRSAECRVLKGVERRLQFTPGANPGSSRSCQGVRLKACPRTPPEA